ncbi:MAG TPA: aminoglycoside phosphotransferase family protein [Actinomycetes bacterium]|nr:aminoglycoside phosphotransferase family protein [Actinomycetes bacterium]
MDSALPSIDAGTRRRLTARFGDGVEAWFDRLPDILTALARRWRLELGPPIPRGSMSVVLRCRTADGRPAVLKTSPDRGRLAFEAAALKAWRTGHVPAVLALDERLGAMLMEAIEPGTPLVVSSAHPGVERIAELLEALHGGPPPRRAYPTVEEHVRYLFDASVRLYQRHPQVDAVVPPDLYERGRALATRLARHDLPTVLLHGDLTPSNVLDGGAGRGLVAIDPAACTGDAAFDAVDLLLWQADDLETIQARAERLAEATGMDAGRMLAWCAAFAGMNALEMATQGAPGARIEVLVGLAGAS